MGVRYRNTFYSYAGVNWKIDIGDSAYSSTVNLFVTGAEGFNLSYKGLTERCDPIMASTVSVPFMVETLAMENFITQIMTAQEERFTVQIYKDTVLYWSGVLLADQVQQEDTSYPYEVSLTFTDGLARLKDLDYNNNGVVYTGRDTLLEHVLICLNRTGVQTLYTTSAYFLLTGVNYYEVQQNYASAKCPLAYTDLNHSIFYEYDEDGTLTFKNCYDVLEMILRRFNARIMMVNGYFHIVQAQDYSRSFYYVRRFDKAGTLINYSSSTFRITPAVGNRKAGGVHKYLPPIKQVSVKLKPKVTNLSTGSFLPVQSKYETTVSFLNTVYVGLGGTTTLFFSGKIHEWYGITNPATTPTPFFTRWNLKVIKTKVSDGSKEYLRGSMQSPNPGITTWSSNSAHIYDIWGSIKEGYSWHSWTEFAFTTPGFSEDCSFEFQLVVNNHFNTNIQPYTIGVNEYWDYECQNFEATSSYDFSQDEDSEIEYTAVNTMAGGGDVASTVKLALPDTLIGDGPFTYSLGKLMVSSNGSTFANSASWGVHNSTNRKTLNKLSVTEILNGQRVPVEKYQGGWIDTNITAVNALIWGQKIFVPLMINIDPVKDEATGEWFNCVIPPL